MSAEILGRINLTSRRQPIEAARRVATRALRRDYPDDDERLTYLFEVDSEGLADVPCTGCGKYGTIEGYESCHCPACEAGWLINPLELVEAGCDL